MSMNAIFTPIHPDGWRFVGIFAAVSLILFMINSLLGGIGFILTGWCYYFFRLPKRSVPQDQSLIISPADGTVVDVKEVTPPAILNLGSEPLTRVSIFLNVFDVHVNRVPLSGKIVENIYHPGTFVNASFDKASDQNERLSLVVEHESGKKVGFVQIAGLIARRIRCDIDIGDNVSTGQVYGLIRFGSRADVYLPKGVNPMVFVGQKMISGETILGDLQNRLSVSSSVVI